MAAEAVPGITRTSKPKEPVLFRRCYRWTRWRRCYRWTRWFHVVAPPTYIYPTDAVEDYSWIEIEQAAYEKLPESILELGFRFLSDLKSPDTWRMVPLLEGIKSPV